MSEQKILSERSSQLFSLNSVFVEELYNEYVKNPNCVDESWQKFFKELEENKEFIRSPSWANYEKKILDVSRETIEGKSSVQKEGPKESSADSLSAKVSNLIHSYRARGHYLASIDPLGMEEIVSKKDIRLDLEYFGINENDLNVSISVNSEVCGTKNATARQVIANLERIYSGNVGYEFSYTDNLEENEWLQSKIENFEKNETFTKDEKKEMLDSLLQVESFEQFLQSRFPGAKRFSIEGADNAIISARKVIRTLVEDGVEDIVIGMPHRGRLNVLTKILNKPYRSMFSEFQGKFAHPESLEITGDVKYHLGASYDLKFHSGKKAHLSLAANPSHLEAVNPVVVGKVRAKQDHFKDTERKKVAGILFHGEAAFAGQGVVMESLMLSELSGYNAGGTIHIVVNNQVGFTATGKEAHLGRYSTEIAKIVKAPIFHVNGNCTEEVAKVSQIAAEYRNKYKKDVIIDLVCYRLHGHNEIDEPRFTQPKMYEKISTLETPGKIYSDQLVSEKVIDSSYFENSKEEYKKQLDKELEASKTYKPEVEEWFEGLWKGLSRYSKSKSIDKKTGVAVDALRKIGKSITTIPEGFNAHKIIVKGFQKREEALSSGANIDWGLGEALAFGSLLSEGTRVRLSGQDCKRGTFSHRHGVITDQDTGNSYTPLNNLAKTQGEFEVINSFLSEYAVMGFEYGYSTVNPNNLVIWEAQFGDFSNGAQIIIDQFLSSAEVKWMRASGLVLLLPHGYEGQGPEHSSARLERYLQLCAENNMQVVNCTTPANYFHALRRQMHRNYRKPLIVMTPKSLLRHPLAVSSIEDFDSGTSFLPVISDSQTDYHMAKKLILCSGKVYYDLVEALDKEKKKNIAIIRIEQYYPFPEEKLKEELKKYKNVKDILWAQEEPRNMGAWYFIRPKIEELMKELKIKEELQYVGRVYSASTADGYVSMHNRKQQEIIKEAIN